MEIREVEVRYLSPSAPLFLHLLNLSSFFFFPDGLSEEARERSFWDASEAACAVFCAFSRARESECWSVCVHSGLQFRLLSGRLCFSSCLFTTQ